MRRLDLPPVAGYRRRAPGFFESASLEVLATATPLKTEFRKKKKMADPTSRVTLG